MWLRRSFASHRFVVWFGRLKFCLPVTVSSSADALPPPHRHGVRPSFRAAAAAAVDRADVDGGDGDGDGDAADDDGGGVHAVTVHDHGANRWPLLGHSPHRQHRPQRPA